MAGKFKMPSIKDVEQEENKDVVVKEKFKVGAGLLSDISKGAVVMDVVNIPRDQIQKNPNNHYSISGIESLAESIKQYGLLQPVHVTAIDKLIADAGVPDWTEDTLIPCVIKGAEDVKLDLSPENKERYAIITSNREQRAYTDGDRYMEIQEWKKIIEELRSKGIEYINGVDNEGNEKQVGIKGEKTRDILAQTTGMSRGQINNYEAVHNSGSEKLKDALLQGKISVSAAAKAAKELSDKEQDSIAKAAEQGEKVTPADISTQANKEFILTQSEFKKDIKNILSAIKEKEITLDGQDQEKYHFHIRQLEKLIGGQK